MTKPIATVKKIPKTPAKTLERARKARVTASQKKTVGQFMAAIAAAFLPVVSFVVAHYEMAENHWKIILVIAALMFSAPTLVDWAVRWTNSKFKAIGFTALLEISMLASSTAFITYVGLAILCVINCHSAWELAGQRLKKEVNNVD
jgi:hypothetical protein